MTRADTIQKVWQAIQDAPYYTSDMEDATAIVDAILPQVTTEAELLALTPGTIVLTGNGYPWERGNPGEDDGDFIGLTYTVSTAAQLLHPIWDGVTVVWDAEVTA